MASIKLSRLWPRPLTKTRNRPVPWPMPVWSAGRRLQFSTGAVRQLQGPTQVTQPDPAPNAVPVENEPPPEPTQIPKGAWKGTAFKMAESALTTFASIAILGLVGYSYTLYYKRMVLKKMENAFAPGDPVLDLAFYGNEDAKKLLEEHAHWASREEQPFIDSIVAGGQPEHYFLLIGEKGVGKSSMLIEAMRKIDGEGVAMFEAHSDPEIFRIRLGKALDFEYHEDNIGSLFSIRGPREANAILDVERAFNKLEKVALKRRETVGRPLIIIVNSVHLLRDDDDGKDLIELLQQRAEQWAASNLITLVLNSDDYWVYERLKTYGARLKVMPIMDLTKTAAFATLKAHRLRYFNEVPSEGLLEQVYSRLGGRVSFLSRVATERDMLKACEYIEQTEKTWFLNQCGILGSEMDDDVMDQQKFASAAMVLAKRLVDMEKEKEEEIGKSATEIGKEDDDALDVSRSPPSSFDANGNHLIPSLPLYKAREVMTRADFIQKYDHDNIFTISADGRVRADSVPMMRAFRSVCAEPGFDKFLEDTLERIGDIESLGRTRELTIKDLWNGGKYQLSVADRRGNPAHTIEMQTVPGENEEDDDKSGGS